MVHHRPISGAVHFGDHHLTSIGKDLQHKVINLTTSKYILLISPVQILYNSVPVMFESVVGFVNKT